MSYCDELFGGNNNRFTSPYFAITKLAGETKFPDDLAESYQLLAGYKLCDFGLDCE